MELKAPYKPDFRYGIKRCEVGGFTLTESVYPAGLSMPRHAHEPASFSLVVGGAYTEVYGKKRTRACASSTLVFHPADEAHSVAFHGAETRILNVALSARLADYVRGHSVILDSPVDFRGGTPPRLAARLYHEWRSWDDMSALVIEGLALEILAESSRRSAGRLESSAPRWLGRAREILHARFAENLKLKEIADSVEVHPVHLAREFRKHYRSTVGEYVRRLRVEHACRELAAGDASVSSIAAATGFADQSHLTRIFKRHTGMTPAEFRRRSR
ncbi:MAG TPA: AraC family transcriptional regulator [Pyrinomonadaceae bacterium]|jgi:AraC family transcriptional regulator